MKPLKFQNRKTRRTKQIKSFTILEGTVQTIQAHTQKKNKKKKKKKKKEGSREEGGKERKVWGRKGASNRERKKQ